MKDNTMFFFFVHFYVHTCYFVDEVLQPIQMSNIVHTSYIVWIIVRQLYQKKQGSLIRKLY